jgi:flagellar basal body-associated protein FliL
VNSDIVIITLIWILIAAVAALLFWWARKQYAPPTTGKGDKKTEYLAMPDEIERDLDYFIRSTLRIRQEAETKKSNKTKNNRSQKPSPALAPTPDPSSTASTPDTSKEKSWRSKLVTIIVLAIIALSIGAFAYSETHKSRAVVNKSSGVISFFSVDNHNMIVDRKSVV